MDDLIPHERMAFQRDEGPWHSENPVVWVNLPPDWKTEVVKADRPVFLPIPMPVEPLDFRGVLFGRSMTRHFAQRMIGRVNAGHCPDQYVAQNELPWDVDSDDPRLSVANRWYALTVQVHADWLMTERADLENEIPRVFLHRGREWAEREEDNRQRQWCDLRRPPRPLDRNTHTYRYGPMNRSEVVVYFDLCREVISHGWKCLVEQPRLRTDVTRLSDLLYDHVQQWLREGSIDEESPPPAPLIESSRRHMPVLADGTHLDCDCPLCRMMSENQNDEAGMFYPMFAGFDGHHLETDDEFAFSLYATREEFDEAQASYREFNDQFERERSEKEERIARGEEVEESPIWDGFVQAQSDGVSIMDIAFRMTEFVGDLKRQEHIGDEQSARPLIDILNDRFDRLRNAPPHQADRTIAMSDLVTALEQAGIDFPDLRSKSSDLQSVLHEWSRQPIPDFDDDEPY